MTMNNLGWIFGIICLFFLIAIIFFERNKTRKTINTLDYMLTLAMDGNFKESTFDESMLSALEIKFSHYLSASVISSQRLSEEKNKIKELISDISHQTKTPIANLLLYTELLQEENLSLEAKEYVNALHYQSEKLRFLIDTLVKLSRLENGIITLQPKENEINTVFQQIQQQFTAKAVKKGLTLNVTPTNITANFDSKWTTEALCNLVDNAIKYTDSGSVSISATPYELFVHIDVKDTGIGILEDEQAKIFSRFFRSNTSSQQDGAGIGLYLAREILHSEGGYIKVSSDVGKGSVFSMFLPSSN